MSLLYLSVYYYQFIFCLGGKIGLFHLALEKTFILLAGGTMSYESIVLMKYLKLCNVIPLCTAAPVTLLRSGC